MILKKDFVQSPADDLSGGGGSSDSAPQVTEQLNNGVNSIDMGSILDEYDSEDSQESTQDEPMAKSAQNTDEEAENETELAPEGEEESDPEQEDETEDQEEESEEKEEELDFIIEHGGKKYAVKNRDQATQLMQMGLDYTRKTQALSDEKKKFYEERESIQKQVNETVSQFEKEINEKRELMSVAESYDSYLTYLAETNPELHQQIADGFTSYQKQTRNPILEHKINQLTNEIETLRNGNKQAEQKAIEAKRQSEIDTFKTKYRPMLEKSGLKPEWKKVMDLWEKNPDLGLESSFMAIYGNKVTALNASKVNVLKAKTKAGQKPAMGAGKVGSVVKGTPKNNKNSSYHEMINNVVDDVMAGNYENY